VGGLEKWGKKKEVEGGKCKSRKNGDVLPRNKRVEKKEIDRTMKGSQQKEFGVVFVVGLVGVGEFWRKPLVRGGGGGGVGWVGFCLGGALWGLVGAVVG